MTDVLAEVRSAKAALPADVAARVHLACLPMEDAAENAAIQDQIEDGVSGILLRDPADLDELGAAMTGLLADPARAAELGDAARLRVRDHFINARHLIQYAELFEHLAEHRSPPLPRSRQR